MPAGLLELEALAQALHLRIAVCSPTTSTIIWVGQPLRQQMVLLYWQDHWSLLPFRIQDDGDHVGE
eukprot:7055189-Prorocentrum_lima.AAC.1